MAYLAAFAELFVLSMCPQFYLLMLGLEGALLLPE